MSSKQSLKRDAKHMDDITELPPATRGRLDVPPNAVGIFEVRAVDLRALLTAYDALRAAQAQAAPVLEAGVALWELGAHTAACQAGMGDGGCEPTCAQHRAIIAAWRAAREG